MNEHISLENINKLYKYFGKCDDPKQYKIILEADMVSTTKGFSNDSWMSPRGCYKPRWENFTSGYQIYQLKGLNLR